MAETRKEYNPAYKGLAPREYEMSIPSEGEIFLEGSWSGEEGRFVPYQRVGDKIQRISFDPNKIYSQFNVSEKARMDSVKGIPAYYDKSRDALIGVVDRYGREEVLLENASQQFGGTPQQYNIGDVRRYLGDAGWAYDFTPMQTQPETPAEPSTTITGEGAESYTEIPGFSHEIEEAKTKQNTFEATQQQLEQARQAAIQIGKEMEKEYGPSSYQGGSIVDYLKSVGKDSSFSKRKSIAESLGITDYTGTAEQNTKMLNVLRGQEAPSYESLISQGGVQQDLDKGLPADTLTGETPIDVQQRSLDGGEEPIDNIVNRSYGSTQEIQSMQDIVDMLKTQFEETGKARETAEKGFAASFKKLVGLSEDRESMQDVLQQQYEEWGIPENFEKIQKLGPQIANLEGEIADIKAQRDQQLMQSEQRQAPMSFIRGEKALIERQYNSKLSATAAELGAKQSLLQAYQGNIAMARNFVSDTVDALAYDTKQNRQDITDFMTYYSDQLTRLSNEEQNYFSSLLNYYNTQLDWQRTDYRTKLEMIVDAASNGVDLGIGASDIQEMTLEEVTSLYTQKVGGTTSTSTSDFTSQEKRKLEQAGLLNASRQEQLDYLYSGDEEDVGLTDTQLNKLAAEGVPEGIAKTISFNLRNGVSLQTIHDEIVKDGISSENVTEYINKYKEVMAKTGTISIPSEEDIRGWSPEGESKEPEEGESWWQKAGGKVKDWGSGVVNWFKDLL